MISSLHTETRRGRCGETANCKALILRSMGFEVRKVTDWTDHVWVETYSDARQRWIAGEKQRKGKLTYIMAFSHEEVFCTGFSRGTPCQ